MTEENSAVMDTARLWMFRVNEPGFDDWPGLTDWLEADPGHLAAYEAALDEDAWAAQLTVGASRGADPATERVRSAGAFAGSPAERPRPTPWRRPFRLAFGGVAAVALVAVGTWTVMNSASSATEIVTAGGEHRSIALPDGSRLNINGFSRVAYDPQRPRLVTLEYGEALFEVHHDASRPFVVITGDARLIDAGTVFNVIHEGGQLEVAVAEGAVIYDAGKEPVRLGPGDALVRAGPAAEVELRKADPASVGDWRDGILQYDDVLLGTVARDLSRALSKPVRAARGAEIMRFSGTLAVDGPAQDVIARAGPLLGVTFSEREDAWEMLPADGAPR